MSKAQDELTAASFRAYAVDGNPDEGDAVALSLALEKCGELERQVIRLEQENGDWRSLASGNQRIAELEQENEQLKGKNDDLATENLALSLQKLQLEESGAEPTLMMQRNACQQKMLEACKERNEAQRQLATREAQLETARGALQAYSDGDECACADGSPDQPKDTKRCAYCLAQDALAALSGEGKGEG
jgi:hypothetical protein